ncbi:MAG: winged helix-turn-helix transcriptional regulator [Euryarchaeota archaeon]|nr:winged helix-turn-helix transcriptional regulator [Euryarchaeota archaeon]
MRSRWFSVLVVCALVGSLPSVAAEPAEISLDLALPVRMAGDTAVTPTDAVLLAQSSRGALDWSLDAGRLTLVEVEVWTQASDDGVPTGAAASGVRTTEHALADATVTIVERRAGFTALAWSEGATGATSVSRSSDAPMVAAEDPSWWTAPDLRVFRLGDALSVSSRMTEDGDVAARVLGRPVPFDYSVPSGSLHLQAFDAAHRLSGALSSYLAEAEVVVRHADGSLSLSLTERIEERAGSVYVPGEGWTGPGSHEERVLRYVQLATAAGRLAVDTVGMPAALFAERLDMTLSGHLGASDALGSLVLEDGETVAASGGTFVVSGDVTGALAPSEAPERAVFSGSGDVAYVRSGATESSFAVAAAVAGAALGLALLAAIGAAAWKLKGAGLGGLLLFSRVSRSKALEHDARSEIYELVKGNPGISAHEVVERLGLGWSTVTYHMGVLERTELVVAHKEGRHRRYFDRTSGLFANGRKKVVSVLKNETSARIAEAVRDRPGLVQRRIAEEFGLAPSSVNWHIKRLVESGLVVKERAARAMALRPGPAWDKLEATTPVGVEAV